MTPPDDDPPQPPKRRRKPPRGLEGFDTGYPTEEEAPVSDAVPRKPIWTESSPADSPATTEASQPVTTEASQPVESVVVDPELGPSGAAEPAFAPSLGYPAFDASTPASAPIPTAIPEASTHPYSSQPYGGSVEWPSSAPDASGQVATSLLSSSLDRDEPLSAAYVGTSDADLRDAVGARSAKHDAAKVATRTPPPDEDDDFDGSKPRSKKLIVVSIASLVVGLGVAALIFLGRTNSAWFYISCETDRIVAEQGRSFPPWGESTLDGKQWTAIKIPPDAECAALATESEDALSDQFRTLLVKRASVLLTAKEVTKTDEANALLEQALLHTRSNTDSARNARGDIQRLLGDVVYWRASLKMRDASKGLIEAAKQFDTAAQQRPRHVTDAAAWADYVRKVVGELEAGPSGISQTFPPTPPPSDTTHPTAPPGVALPVEPDQGSASEPSPVPPDAGLPTGGVLL